MSQTRLVYLQNQTLHASRRRLPVGTYIPYAFVLASERAFVACQASAVACPKNFDRFSPVS